MTTTAADLRAALRCADPQCECQGEGEKLHCPAHKDDHPSLSVDERGGTLLWTCRAGCDQSAVTAALRSCGLLGGPANGHHSPERSWEIRDTHGRHVATHHRVDLDAGGKNVWWTRPDGGRGLGGVRSKDLPLYGAEQLGDAPAVVIAEGEKATDALTAAGIPAVGTVTGASGVPSDESLKPLIDRRVVLWADHDDMGRQHMQKLAERLLTLGVPAESISRVTCGERPGDDAADAVDRGEDLTLIVATAPVWRSSPQSKQHQPIRAVPLRELLSQQMPPRVFVLEPLFQVKDVMMLHAFRGVGKSRIAHGMALAIASGGAFLKYTAPEPRRVLLVDGELPPEELQRMFAQAVEAAGPLQVDPEIHILSADLSGENLPSLVSRPGQQIVEDHLREGDVLMLDALTTLCTGAGPENDAESWDEMQAWLLQLRRAEITTLLLHHDNRSGGQRGTSRKEDVLSQVIQLRRPADYQPEQGARFEVHLTKARGVFGPDAEPFEAWLQTENDRPWWTWSKLGDARAIQAARLQEQGLTQRQIAKELGVGVTTVNRALARAKKQGR